MQLTDVIEEERSLPQERSKAVYRMGRKEVPGIAPNSHHIKRNLIFLIQTPIVKGRGRKRHEQGHPEEGQPQAGHPEARHLFEDHRSEASSVLGSIEEFEQY
jgi:hypothetical protein